MVQTVETRKIVLVWARRNWLWLLVNMSAMLLLAWLLWRLGRAPFSSGLLFFTSGATQAILLFSGKVALVLLALSLACTPAARILGFRAAISVRKSLGLWSFAYACFHALFFLGGKRLFVETDAWLSVLHMLPNVFDPWFFGKVPYARAGAIALALLIPLAATSSRAAMRILGKNWKRLHRLVYIAAPVAVYHYWWREDLMERPDYRQPLLFAAAVGLLLIVRIPAVRRPLARRLRIQRQRPASTPGPAETVAQPHSTAASVSEQNGQRGAVRHPQPHAHPAEPHHSAQDKERVMP